MADRLLDQLRQDLLATVNASRRELGGGDHTKFDGENPSHISHFSESGGKSKSLEGQAFPTFPTFPTTEPGVDKSANLRTSECPDRTAADAGARARGAGVVGKVGNAGNANTGKDIASLSLSHLDRESGKCGKSWPPADLIRPGYDPEDILALFEERAAIREFDGEMPRREAEAAAADDVREAIRDGRIARISRPIGSPLF